ncbi:MAG TPA: hypothetical protein VGQ29_11455 [Gemmatimonadales bacterium]|nr:hypothetical protein [Gemmatimonadales bacterium]
MLDALDRGYRGAEADIVREGTELLVSHDRRHARATGTLAGLYLERLRNRTRSCGYVLPDSTRFYLNIELKEADSAAFRLLLAELRAYEELFQSRDSAPAPTVQITLVGWWPPVEPGRAAWPSYLRIHLPISRDTPIPEDIDSARIGLISIDYSKSLRWNGRGRIPQPATEVLARARALANALAVPLRVHHAPVQRDIFEWLLAEGVTMIGASDLDRARSLLLELAEQP